MLAYRLRRRPNTITTMDKHDKRFVLARHGQWVVRDKRVSAHCQPIMCDAGPPPRLHLPANTRCSSNAGLMLVHRLRRWPNIKPALDKRIVFAGLAPLSASDRRVWCTEHGNVTMLLLLHSTQTTQYPRQTQHVDGRAGSADGAPTLNQHLFNVWCLLVYLSKYSSILPQPRSNFSSTVQCF